MKVLLIEDNDNDIQAFQDSVTSWNIGKAETFEVEVSKTLDDALSKVNQSNEWDGIVLDLKLPNGTNGRDVVNRLNELYLRVPVIILTGTPSENDDYQGGCLKTLKKGEQQISDILELLWDCKRSGLMDLIGGKGLFEKHLKTVFDKCIVPRFDEWRDMMKTVEPDKADTVTSEALSRHVLTCLGLLLSNDTEKIQPEECYVLLPDDAISCPRPGMILKDSNEIHYLVLNPACDLAIRFSGHSNSNVLLLVQIKPENDMLKSILIHPKKNIPLDDEQKAQNKVIRNNAFKNNGPHYFHWLPACGKFQGGFVNFRYVITCAKTQYKKEYHLVENKYVVHPEVLKNIQSRFANYYARQGQPDIDYTRFSSASIEGFI